MRARRIPAVALLLNAMLFGGWCLGTAEPTSHTTTVATPMDSAALNKDAVTTLQAQLPNASAPDQPLLAFGGGYVGALAFSPDGKTCAIGRGKYLLLMDAQTGQCRRVLGGHGGMVAGAAFSSDGSKIVTSAFDRKPGYDEALTSYGLHREKDYSARLWNVADGHCLRIFKGHTRAVVGVAISTNGSRIATGSDDGTAKVWDAGSGECLLTLKGHTRGISAITIAPDGNTIMTGSADGTARLWNAKSGDCLQTLTGHTSPVFSVAISPDGQLALTGSLDKTARVWNIKTGKQLHKMNCGSFFGSRIRTGTDDFFGPLPPTDLVVAVAFSADGNSLLTGLSAGSVIEWSTVKGKRLREIDSKIKENVAQRKSPGICRTIAFSKDDSSIMTGALDGLVRLWDAQTATCVQTFGGNGNNGLEAIALSPDGKTLATGSHGCATCLWNAGDGRCRKTLKFRDEGAGWPVTGIAFARDGERLLTASMDGRMRVWQINEGQVLRTSRGAGNNGYRGAAGTPDGMYAVVVDGTHSAHLMSLEDERLIRSFTPAHGDATDVRCAVSPDCTRVIATGGEGPRYTTQVNIWNAETGNCERLIDLEAKTANDVCFSEDSQTFLTGWRGSMIRLWRASDGNCLRELDIHVPLAKSNSHEQVITSLTLSPDGKLALTGLVDGRIMLWRIADGQCLRVLQGHLGAVTYVRFMEHGVKFLSASDDNLVLLWKTEP